MKNQKSIDALKKAKESVDQGNQAIESALQELSLEDLSQINGGSAWDNVPPVIEHPYEPNP